MNKQTIQSFFWGIGSLGNIGGNYIDFSQYLNQSDYNALMSDWIAVGKDMKKVMNSLSLKQLTMSNTSKVSTTSNTNSKENKVIASYSAKAAKVFQGPLPTPEDFAQYEACLTGAADRILKMTE